MATQRIRLAALAVAAAALAGNLVAADPSPHDLLHERKTADLSLAEPLASQGRVGEVAPCVGGLAAGEFPCRNVDLLAHLPLDAIGGGVGNDIWGWTDPSDGREYALVGKSTGLAIVDVTDPVTPVWLGDVATQTVASPWRDVKVAGDTAYIVSEASLHGIQAFDLSLLRTADALTPRTWPAINLHIPTGSVHNVAVNASSGRLYAVGSSQCDGGPLVLGVSTFAQLSVQGCVDLDGYTHDLQCVTYAGPDVEHTGREICLAANEDTLTVLDLTDPDAPELLSRTTYAGARYTHQGWLTEDQGWFLVGDELDELRDDVPTTTLVFDVSDLDDVRLAGRHQHATTAIDHNLYVTGDVVHQANYRAGYRLQRITDPATADLDELAYFDVYPADDDAAFNGAWSVYPFFSSGTVVVSSIDGGLFVLRPTVGHQPPSAPGPTEASPLDLLPQ